MRFIRDQLLSTTMRETPEEVERDFDLWKLDRDA